MHVCSSEVNTEFSSKVQNSAHRLTKSEQHVYDKNKNKICTILVASCSSQCRSLFPSSAKVPSQLPTLYVAAGTAAEPRAAETITSKTCIITYHHTVWVIYSAPSTRIMRKTAVSLQQYGQSQLRTCLSSTLVVENFNFKNSW